MKRLYPFLVIITIFSVNTFSALPDYSCDTITFDLRSGVSLYTGAIIFDFSNEQIVDAMHYSRLGGFIPNDSTVRMLSKYSPDGSFEYRGEYDNNTYQFAYYSENGDTLWNEAVTVPDSLVTCGTYREDSTETGENMILCFQSSGSELPDPFPSYSERMNVNMIWYIQKGNRFIKMQIINYTTHIGTYGPDNTPYTEVVTLTVRCATDSAGNRQFRKESVPIYTRNRMAISDGCRNYRINGNSVMLYSNASASTSVIVYSVAGKEILPQCTIGYNRRKSIHLQSGVYLITYGTSDTRNVQKIIIQ